MPRDRRPGRKIRVNFRQNRGARRRTDHWTRRFHDGDDALSDEHSGERVRAKGDLSRKRTIIVDEDDLPTVAENLWLDGLVVRVHGQIAYVHDAEHREWSCTVRRVLRTLLIDQRSTVSVGDRVKLSDASQYADGDRVGVIERVEPRTSTLTRRDGRGRAHVIVANADQLLIVVSVAEPMLKPHLVDRYLIAAEKGGLEPLICFTKIDLLSDELLAESDEDDEAGLTVGDIIAEFRALGYTCFLTDSLNDVGVDEVRAQLSGKVTVLSGQSGVGKSSLINAVEPGLDLATGTVSSDSQKGRHTTRFAQLWPLASGGYVVDTPGIRAFDLWNLERGEIEAYFREIAPLVSACDFRNCTHCFEDGCGVIAAAERGEISERRYYSYRKMFEEQQ